jgi:predicted DNA-binding transcriptional regulator AlpA
VTTITPNPERVQKALAQQARAKEREAKSPKADEVRKRKLRNRKMLAAEPTGNRKPRPRRRRAGMEDDAGPVHLHPDYFYRFILGPKFFGYELSRLYDAIRDGIVPPPVSISDSGRAKGWFGREILRWQEERQKLALAKAGE